MPQTTRNRGIELPQEKKTNRALLATDHCKN